MAMLSSETKSHPAAKDTGGYTMKQRRKFLQFAGAAAIALSFPHVATAQTYPTRPVTMIVPFPPGGNADVIGRVLAERMRVSLGQTIIVENVGGANGSIGVGRVARARPDGYTIDLGFLGGHVQNGALYSLPYERVERFRTYHAAGSDSVSFIRKENDAGE
jgi:tripartite-type tricarboxylate transporter receptor subunit TctC